jgi:uncharacterized protein YndB with AHSA1/START domain
MLGDALEMPIALGRSALCRVARYCRMDYQTISPIDHYTALDGFSDETGAVNAELPRSNWDVTFTDASGRTLVQTIVAYKSSDDLQKVIDMGMKEGLTSTLERLDELLLTLNEQRKEG